MMKLKKLLYCPTLRMKSGELEGVRALATDVADHVLPRFIVPPPSERDENLQQKLIETPTRPEIASLLSSHWGVRPALVEATYLLDEFGRDNLLKWLPQMFERARLANVNAIINVQLDDLIDGNHSAYAAAIQYSDPLQFGLVISSGDIGNQEKIRRALNIIEKMKISPERCLVSADFHDADLSSPDIVSPVIAAALEDLQQIAPWYKVVFQGTNFPTRNKAQPGGHIIIQRNEWVAWKQAVTFAPETGEHLVFGDYVADCAKMLFGEGHGRAIPHLRYTTPDSWLLQRGSDKGRHSEVMRNVSKAIVDSGVFAGRSFSSADDHIYKMAHGLVQSGTAKDWRALNTTHHITRVVNDIGSVKGVLIHRAILDDLPIQPSLFAKV